MRLLKSILIVWALVMSIGLSAQLTVAAANAQQMVDQLEGQGVTILNPVVSSGISVQSGLFQANVPNFDIQEGVLLCTGRIEFALGPNEQTSQSFVTTAAGDSSLSLIAGYETADACVLEFDFIPAGDTIRFDFSFASEEYDEYVCSNFNDAFAFILSGVTDPLEVTGNYGEPNKKNLAIVPGTGVGGIPPEWVSINSINGGDPGDLINCPPVNSQFYQGNPLNSLGIEYDGWTRGLTAFADSLTPCNTYHLKLVIADATDRIFDSGVFIEKITSNEVTLDIETEGGNNVMYEGCNDATVTFCYDNPVSEDTDIDFQISGTAINGTDYTLSPNPGSTPTLTVTVPEGQTCAEIDINTIDDGLGEPLETVVFTVFNPNPTCDGSQSILDVQTVYLYDSLEVFITGDTVLCLGESTTLGTDSGGTSFVWGASPSVVFNPPTSDQTTIIPTQTTQVMVTSTIAACVATDEVTVAVSDMSLDLTIVGESCDNACNGSITLDILNGVPNYNITWNDGNLTPPDPLVLTGLCQGWYTVRVTDASGCSVTDSAFVDIGNQVDLTATPVEYNGGFNVSCNGECDGQIFVASSGGGGDYDYEINPPATFVNQAFIDLCAISYTVIVTDQISGCQDSIIVNLTEPEPKELVVTDLQPVPCVGGDDGCATVECVGGSGNPVLYVWVCNGDTVATGTNYCGPAGTCNVTAIDDNGCEATTIVNFTEPGDGLTCIVDTIANVSCNGVSDGAVCIQVSGGSGGYQYTWTNANSDTLGTAPCLFGLSGGLYVVYITDSGGCEISKTIQIEEPLPLDALILDLNHIQCEGQDCGDIVATGIGGTPFSTVPNYQYEWNPVGCPDITGYPQFPQAIAPCEPCDYNVQITDANGCKTDTTVTINIISPAITWSFNVTDVDCAGDSTGAIDLTFSGGVPGYTYEWIGGNCGLGPFDTQDLTNVCAGVYCLTLTDSEGCSRDTCIEISEPPAFDAIFSMTPTDCFDICTGEIDLIPFGGTPYTVGDPYVYSWQGPITIFPPFDFSGMPVFSTQEDLTDLCKGIYLVTIMDSLGCVVQRQITVTAPDDMVIDNIVTSNYNGWQISCPGACDGSICVDVTGGTTDPPGDYQCTIFEPDLGFSDFGNGVPCWDDLCASEDTLGYEIIKVDDNGCIQNTFVIMAEPEEFTFNADSIMNVSCSGESDGELYMDINGGVPDYLIAVKDSVGTIIFQTTSNTGIATVSGLAEGCYTICVTDMNSCTSEEEVCIETPDPIIATMNYVPYGTDYGVSCDGECNGIAYVTVNGGTPYTGNLYDFVWWDTACGVDSISNAPNVLSNLCVGDYYATVTDSLGCSVCPPDGVELTAPSALNDSSATVIDITCFGDDDGFIDPAIDGGEPAYEYSWVPPPADPDASTQSNLPPNTYTLLVTDQLGCDSIFEYEINEPDSLSAFPIITPIGAYDVSCALTCDGSFELVVVGGTQPYSVVWSGGGCVGGSTSLIFNDCVCAGDYDYLVTDDNGCTISGTVTLTSPPPITMTVNEVQGISCFGECDGQLSVNPINGGTPPYLTVEWFDSSSNSIGFGTFTNGNLCDDMYTVVVTDSLGCTGTETYDLMEPEMIELNCVVNNVSCFGFNNGSICCTPTGGTLPYNILWTGPNGFISTLDCIEDIGPGEYCLTLSDANGCEIEECYTITEPPIMVVDIDVFAYEGGFGVSCFGVCDGMIDVNISGGTPPFNIVPDTTTLVNLCADDYVITVIDDLGCVFVDTVTVTEGPPLDVNLEAVTYQCGTNISCFGFCDGFIDTDVSGGDPGSYMYTWKYDDGTNPIDTIVNMSTNPADSAQAGLCEGEYIICLEDGNGCTGSDSIGLIAPAVPFEIDISFDTYPSGDTISCAGACDGLVTITPSGNCGEIEIILEVFGEETYVDTLYTDGSPVTTSVCSGDIIISAFDDSDCPAIWEGVLVGPEELDVLSVIDQSLCYGDSAGVACFTILGGSLPYTTSWDGPTPLDADSCALNLPNGFYVYEVMDVNGCQDSVEVTIAEPDSISIELFSPLASNGIPFNVSCPGCMDGVIQSDVMGGTMPYTYSWSGLDQTPPPTTPDIDSLAGGDYCLFVTDFNGCEKIVCIEVTEPEELVLPNGISPNSDMVNDGLEIPGLEVYPQNTVQIYNRWGNQVFERNNYSNSDQWQGAGVNGNIVPDGTYFVILVVTDVNGEKEELNGYLELRR